VKLGLALFIIGTVLLAGPPLVVTALGVEPEELFPTVVFMRPVYDEEGEVIGYSIEEVRVPTMAGWSFLALVFSGTALLMAAAIMGGGVSSLEGDKD